MPTITVKDGTEIFYKDWGTGQPIVFHHGWPLSADDWDAQMLFFLGKGYRVIAHDRRGHGRSSKTDTGNETDTTPFDGAPLAKHQNLKASLHDDYCIKAFSTPVSTEDVKAIDVPVLVLHGDDDQIVPIADAALKSIKLLKKGELKVYKGYPHGMATTHAEVINADLLAFFKA